MGSESPAHPVMATASAVIRRILIPAAIAARRNPVRALSKEKDKASKQRLADLRKEMAELRAEADGMRAQYDAEKRAIQSVRELRERIEHLLDRDSYFLEVGALAGHDIKGETSGNTLGIQSVWADCDGDTLLYLVDPAGPSCHTGAETCFFRRLEADGTLVDAPGEAAPTLLRLGTSESWCASSFGFHCPR